MKMDSPARSLPAAPFSLCARLDAGARSLHERGGTLLMSGLMSGLVALLASPAMAQNEPLRPPRTTDPPSGPKYLVIFVAVLLLAGVVFAATLRSKRGHQD